MLEPSEYRFFGDQCLFVRSPHSAHEALLLYRRHSASTPGSTLVVQDNIPLRILRLLTSSAEEYSMERIANTIGYAGVDREAYLRTQVKFLRQLLGDDATSPKLVRTVRGVGFVFCSPVEPLFGQEGARKWKELGFGSLPELLAASDTETPELISSRAAGLHAMGVAAMSHGREEQAEPFLAEALALYSALDAEAYDDVYGDPYDEPLERPYAAQQAECQMLLGEIGFRQAKYELAKLRFEQVLVLCERICLEGFELGLVLSLSKWRSCFGGKAALRLIAISLKLGRVDFAEELRISRSAYLSYGRHCEWGGELGSTYREIALVRLAQGEREEGKSVLYAAYLQYIYSKQDQDALTCLIMYADLDREDGEWEDAETSYDLAIELAKKLRVKAAEAQCRERQAEIATFCRYGRDTVSYYEYALECYRDIGDYSSVERCKRALEASRDLPDRRRPRPHVWGGPSALADY